MNTQLEKGCSNLIIQPYPVDTLLDISHVMAFFKEFYEPHNPDFSMSEESRLGFYLLLHMVQQAAQFEVDRLMSEGEVTPTPFSHEPMPKESHKALKSLFDNMLGETDDDKTH